MAGEISPSPPPHRGWRKLPPPPSASRLHGAGAGIHHSALPLRYTSPSTPIPSLEQQRSGESSCGRQVPWFPRVSSEVLGVPHAADEVRGEPHDSGEVPADVRRGPRGDAERQQVPAKEEPQEATRCSVTTSTASRAPPGCSK